LDLLENIAYEIEKQKVFPQSVSLIHILYDFTVVRRRDCWPEEKIFCKLLTFSFNSVHHEKLTDTTYSIHRVQKIHSILAW